MRTRGKRGIYWRRLKQLGHPWPDYISPLALLSEKQAAALLGVHPRTLSRWRRKRCGPQHLSAARHKLKVVFYRVADVLAFRAQLLGAGPSDTNVIIDEWLSSKAALVAGLAPGSLAQVPFRRRSSRVRDLAQAEVARLELKIKATDLQRRIGRLSSTVL